MQKEPKESGRRFPRLATELVGSLKGRASRQVQALDLSLSGCLIRCDALLDRGAIFDLELQLGSTSFGAKARVIDTWVDGDSPEHTPRFLAGLEFLAVPPRDEVALRRFLEGHRRRS